MLKKCYLIYMQTELNSKIKRIEEIQKLIKALFESKYNGEVTELKTFQKMKWQHQHKNYVINL